MMFLPMHSSQWHPCMHAMLIKSLHPSMRTRRVRNAAAALPAANRVDELKGQLDSLRGEKAEAERDISQAERDLHGESQEKTQGC
jgi:hypothetical protein